MILRSSLKNAKKSANIANLKFRRNEMIIVKVLPLFPIPNLVEVKQKIFTPLEFKESYLLVIFSIIILSLRD